MRRVLNLTDPRKVVKTEGCALGGGVVRGRLIGHLVNHTAEMINYVIVLGKIITNGPARRRPCTLADVDCYDTVACVI